MTGTVGYKFREGKQIVTNFRSAYNGYVLHTPELENNGTTIMDPLNVKTFVKPTIFQHELYGRTPLCLLCEALYYMKPTTLANEQESTTDKNGVEFGADNCATRHICTDRSLFI